MKKLQAIFLAAGTALIAAGSVASSANAAIIVNGGFEAQGAVGATCTFGAITGWSTNYRCGAGYYSAAPPEGSVFAFAGNGIDNPGGSLTQTITGLTVGGAYRVNFQLGGENFVVPGVNEEVIVSMLSGSSSPSQLYVAPISSNLTSFGPGPLWDNWAPFSYDFVASATSADIQFQQTPATLGYGDTGVDDVSIQSLSTRVPEPATLALFGAGLLGLSSLRRRRKAKA